MQYNNLASVDHPATIILFVNISESMGTPMSDGKTRIEVAKDAIQAIYNALISRSLRQGTIYPRYRIGMVAYSDNLYNVYSNDQNANGILTIKEVLEQGIPQISPQRWTNMAKAFRYAAHLIKEDLKTWPEKWLAECPPPMVVNITDCEFTEDLEDPLDAAKKLQEISVLDGNVLVENIFITDQINIKTNNPQEWTGYQFNESTGDPFGDKLLAMSSPIPGSYAKIMNNKDGLKISEGTALMFPGIYHEFITTCFPMSVTS